jgi:type II secretory pathway pseudopilin PulG
MRQILKKRLKAFSLLEIAISLTIIGVLTLGVIKGQQILYQARLDKTASQIDVIRTQIVTYQQHYGNFPGVNGDNLDEEKFWNDLDEENLLSKKQKNPSIGGVFVIKKEGELYYIILSNPGNTGLLNWSDATKIQSKLDGSSFIKIESGSNGTCEKGCKEKYCILKIAVA